MNHFIIIYIFLNAFTPLFGSSNAIMISDKNLYKDNIYDLCQEYNPEIKPISQFSYFKKCTFDNQSSFSKFTLLLPTNLVKISIFKAPSEINSFFENTTTPKKSTSSTILGQNFQTVHLEEKKITVLYLALNYKNGIFKKISFGTKGIIEEKKSNNSLKIGVITGILLSLFLILLAFTCINFDSTSVSYLLFFISFYGLIGSTNMGYVEHFIGKTSGVFIAIGISLTQIFYYLFIASAFRVPKKYLIKTSVLLILIVMIILISGSLVSPSSIVHSANISSLPFLVFIIVLISKFSSNVSKRFLLVYLFSQTFLFILAPLYVIEVSTSLFTHILDSLDYTSLVCLESIFFSSLIFIRYKDLLDKEREYKLTESILEKTSLSTQMIAHDLQKPLNMIKNYSEYILKREKNSEINHSFEKSFTKSYNQAEQLIKDILTLGSEKKLAQNINLAKEVFDIVETIKPLKLQNMEIDSNILISINRSDLIRVIQNLIHNAIEATEKFGSIKIIGSEKDSSLQITNSQCYLNKNECLKIFEPFYSTKSTGTGLGLAICKKILGDHGADISCYSDLESNSTSSHINFKKKQS